MNNPRISKKEQGLIKGALRRVFSRSDLRRSVLARSTTPYADSTRPRVKKWSLCPICDRKSPTYKFAVDHIEPLIPTHLSLEDMSWDEIINRLWCEENNLQAICPICHDTKTAKERKERTLNKKGKKKK